MRTNLWNIFCVFLTNSGWWWLVFCTTLYRVHRTRCDEACTTRLHKAKATRASLLFGFSCTFCCCLQGQLLTFVVFCCWYNRLIVLCTAKLNVCREDASSCCHNGMCLPKSLTCDGVDYCTDGSTTAVLCREYTPRLRPTRHCRGQWNIFRGNKGQ